jgi:hypothetical protein
MNVSDKRAIEAAIDVAASAAQQKERDYPRAPAHQWEQLRDDARYGARIVKEAREALERLCK